MNHQQLHLLHPQETKKTWTAPSLIVLSVKETMGSDGSWQFVQEGDFWKRQPLIS